MTRRRKRLLGILAVLALLGVLGLPGVRWRLLGRVRGEPFWRSMPASYYADRVRSGVALGADGLPRLLDPPPAAAWVRSRLPRAVAEGLGCGPPPFTGDPYNRPDAAALPVLVALMR